MISAVIPCFNEAEVLHLTYAALTEAVKTWGDSVEIIFVDDGSSDDTWSIIESLSRRDARVRGVRFSRNFGQQAATQAGLEQARGNAVVVLDADLQDPPSLVEQMLAKWREGYDVVYAQRKQRHGETWFKKVSAHLFYRVLDKVNTVSIPRNVGDFSLLDARVVKEMLALREHSTMWRGLRSWTGFKQTAVPFDRPERAAGKTKYDVRAMVKLATAGLMGFSDLPLRLPLYAGSVALLATMLGGAMSLAGRATGWLSESWQASPGVLAIYFLGSVQLLCLGLVGEYLNRIYDEVRDRPRWVVDRTCGALDAHADTHGVPEPLRRKAG